MRTSPKLDGIDLGELGANFAKIDLHDCALPQAKVCCKCERVLSVTHFGKGNRWRDGLRPECKKCRSHDNAAYYESLSGDQKYDRYLKATVLKNIRQEFVLRYLLDHPCADCGENDPIVLEFDHVRDIKKMDISSMIGSKRNLKELEEEIAKCEVVCRNCHSRRETYRRGDHKIRLLAEIVT